MLCRNSKEYNLQKTEANNLSDLFALNEGRRPRILIGGPSSEEAKEFNVICNTFADMGCNVDIAPNNSNFKHMIKQCLENDVDMLLIFASHKVNKAELQWLQETVLHQIPDMVLSMYKEKSNGNQELINKQDQWIYFDQNSDVLIMASTLLRKLLHTAD